MPEDTNKIIEQRREKLAALREMGINPFPTTRPVSHGAGELHQLFGEMSAEELEEAGARVSIAGRIKAIRDFGNAVFADVYDCSGRVQALLIKKIVGPENHKLFKKSADIGDFFWFEGRVAKTRTGELSVAAEDCALLSKALRPLPEKWHGLVDQETRYRQRYVDLIANPDVVEVFRARSEIVRLVRVFFAERDFIEVETPMLQPLAGGANARPFTTHHNALDMELFMRIAPELYLKRLVVGGFERVYEINRNFRNEGISIKHNPEFTMLEFYEAYTTYEKLMELTEELFCFLSESIYGAIEFPYQGQTIKLERPWRRLTMADSVTQFTDLTEADLQNMERMQEFCARHEIIIEGRPSAGRLLNAIFEAKVEDRLIQPTFIYHYPTEISPLARRNDENPEVVDRFELFIYGREIANGFNELADPEDQRQRFLDQLAAKQAGDEEAHEYDGDYIRALEYGLPPTAGEGIGIDRLVMLLTDQPSIRDVILFPLLRKEQS
ncbi:MAG: lysine--tRNA ligase [Candidatus Lernaella stagnicola]|nr:lysine--tRNA ligase [Candidatus Lernaella stagnicola]